MSLCTSISLVKNTNNGDLLKVVIDNTTEAYWFYDQTDAMQYLGKDVIVEYRKDILDGEMCQFIKTFVLPSVVNTLDKQEGFKLFLEQQDNNSNLSFNEIADGETRGGCIVYCITSEFKSSNNAVWQELLIRDRSMHTAKLRVFNYTNDVADFTGRYILTELSRSKYGFKSDLISPTNGECPPNPEIDIAKQYILNYVSNDAIASSYLERTNLLAFIEEEVDYEPGYGLVRLAMELAMVESMYNITKDVDLQAIGHALIASRGHTTRDSALSDVLNNVLVGMNTNWPNKVLVLQLLDENIEEKPKAYYVYNNIRETVNTLLQVRKGVEI